VSSSRVWAGVRGKSVAPGSAEVRPGVAVLRREVRRSSERRVSFWDSVSSRWLYWLLLLVLVLVLVLVVVVVGLL